MGFGCSFFGGDLVIWAVCILLSFQSFLTKPAYWASESWEIFQRDDSQKLQAEEELELNSKAMGAVIGKGGKGLPQSNELSSACVGCDWELLVHVFYWKTLSTPGIKEIEQATGGLTGKTRVCMINRDWWRYNFVVCFTLPSPLCITASWCLLRCKDHHTQRKVQWDGPDLSSAWFLVSCKHVEVAEMHWMLTQQRRRRIVQSLSTLCSIHLILFGKYELNHSLTGARSHSKNEHDFKTTLSKENYKYV